MPAIVAFTGAPLANDPRWHPGNHLQIDQGAQIVLSWDVDPGIEQVKITVQQGDGEPVAMEPIAAAGGSVTVTPEASCIYRLVAMAAGQPDATSDDAVFVHLNEPGQTVSPIAFAELPAADDEIAAWPLVLCGPMLRRVEPDSVSVFIATKAPCTLKLELSSGGAAIAGEGSAGTIALGPFLHVALVQFKPAAPLSRGQLYAYDIWIKRGEQTTMLSAEVAGLGYGGDKPAFSLPPEDLASLNIIHGSCRKAHAEGSDALPLIDTIFAASWSDAQKRPHQLLLTGDQIYADDVALTLSHLIRRLAKKLTAPKDGDGNWETAYLETFPGDLDIDDADFNPGDARAGFIQDKSGFRDPDDVEPSPGHLIFLGEFYAMYLLMFSPAIWPRGDPLDWLSGTIDGELGPDVNSDLARLAAFRGRMETVRKVMANVPTYTIFDDHEITDDWNLHFEWATQAHQSDAGRQIIRNGLCAYSVFQQWGNTPERFVEGSFGAQILDKLQCKGDQAPEILQTPGALDDVLALKGPGNNPARDARMVWDYAIDGPQHRIIFLDTRTFRDLPAVDNLHKLSCGLLDETAVQPQIIDRKPTGKLAILVSATPYVGLPGMQLAVSLAAFHYTPEYLDNETWAGNSAAFRRVADALFGFGQVVILSGDVHYGFGTVMDSIDGDSSARIVQFCSSSLHKQEMKTSLPGDVYGAAAEYNHLFPAIEPAWDELNGHIESWRQAIAAMPEAEALQAGIDVTGQLAQAATLLMLVQAHVTPAFEQRFLDDDLPGMRDLKDYLSELFSKKRHRVTTLTDQRDPISRGTLGPCLLQDPFTRTVVGACNLGVVTFSRAASGDVTARQTLYWETAATGTSAPQLANTALEAPVGPQPDTAPEPSSHSGPAVAQPPKTAPAHAGAHVFDATALTWWDDGLCNLAARTPDADRQKNLSLEFGLRMYKELLKWELAPADGPGAYLGVGYSIDGSVAKTCEYVRKDFATIDVTDEKSGTTTARPHSEWPGTFPWLPPGAAKSNAPGSPLHVYAFNVWWVLSGYTNCSNSQLAALIAAQPDGQIYVRRRANEDPVAYSCFGDDGAYLCQDLTKPKKSGIYSTQGILRHGFIQVDRMKVLKRKDGSDVAGNTIFSVDGKGPVEGMQLLGIGTYLGSGDLSSDDDDYRLARLGDHASSSGHAFLIGDVCYEVSFKGETGKWLVLQSSFAKGNGELLADAQRNAVTDPDAVDYRKKSLTAEDCDRLIENEKAFLDKVDAFLATPPGAALAFDPQGRKVKSIRVRRIVQFSANVRLLGKDGLQFICGRYYKTSDGKPNTERTLQYASTNGISRAPQRNRDPLVFGRFYRNAR